MAATARAPSRTSVSACGAARSVIVWWDHVWLPRSCPAATMARPRSGRATSHVPTAKTVIRAWRSAQTLSTSRVRSGAPAPWKVSATARAPDGPDWMSGPGVERIVGAAPGCAGPRPGTAAGTGVPGAVGVPAEVIAWAVRAADPGRGPESGTQAAAPRPMIDATPPASTVRRPGVESAGVTGSGVTGELWTRSLGVGWMATPTPLGLFQGGAAGPWLPYREAVGGGPRLLVVAHHLEPWSRAAAELLLRSSVG
jgi:hypothetical protein